MVEIKIENHTLASVGTEVPPEIGIWTVWEGPCSLGHCIEKLENDQVTFRFKNSDTGQWEKATLPVFDFIHRFLQHVLPKGVVKIRYYGKLAA